MKESKYLYLIFAILGFIFLRSGYGKFAGGTFVATLGETLEKMASKNPYPFYKDFLTNTAIPNAQTFAQLTMWGELFAGMVLLTVPISLLVIKNPTKLAYILLGAGFLTGAFLNATFWLAAGHTSPSADGLNLVMFFSQIIGFFFTLDKLKTSD